MKRRNNAVKRAIKAAGLTQAELARRMNYSRTMISTIANGRYVPRLDTALKFCRALGVDNPCALFDENGRPRP